MNSSLVTADAGTHFKIVAVALLAAISVMWVGISARVTVGHTLSSGPQLEQRTPEPAMQAYVRVSGRA